MENKKIKLLFVNSTLEKSGLTNVIFNICKYIDRKLFDITILTLSPEPSNSLWNDFENLGINLFSLNLTRIEWFLKGKKSLVSWVNNFNPDLIQTMSFRATCTVNLLLRHYKIISTIEADLHKNYYDTYGKLIGKYFAEKELVLFDKATIKIVCSKSLKDIYSKKIDNINIVQNGVNEELYYTITTDKKIGLRKKLNLEKDKIIFLSVGSLSKRKDPLTIIKAFKNYKNERPYQLLFLGEGVLMKECIDEATGLDIKFLGNLDNVNEYCQAADVFISASHSEGLPNSVLEAGMCGLYCMLSNIPQHKEIFDSKTKQATFFEIENSNELTTLLNSYENFELTNIIDFSASKMAKQYEELYFKAKALIN